MECCLALESAFKDNLFNVYLGGSKQHGGIVKSLFVDEVIERHVQFLIEIVGEISTVGA